MTPSPQSVKEVQEALSRTENIVKRINKGLGGFWQADYDCVTLAQEVERLQSLLESKTQCAGKIHRLGGYEEIWRATCGIDLRIGCYGERKWAHKGQRVTCRKCLRRRMSK